MKKRICDAAVEVLRETKNEAVMWSDNDEATLVRKWNVLHGTESDLFEVRKVSEGDVC